MRILYITHRVPYPPNKGDKIRSYHILSWLARSNDVWLATHVDDSRDIADIPILEKLAKEVVYARIDSVWRKALYIQALLTNSSISSCHFYSRPLQKIIDRLIREVRFDAVVCSSSPTAEYIFRSSAPEALLQARRIMDLIDVDSMKWQQYAERTSAPGKWVYAYEARKLRYLEESIGRTFDCMILVSDEERSIYPSPTYLDKVFVVGNGVDLNFFSPRDRDPRLIASPSLVFVGMMDYWPNVEGMRWFIKDIFPKVRQACPDTTLTIVGGRPTSEVLSWNHRDGIRVTGFVDDIRSYLLSADVCIIPLRVARGIQNKVLEAMAMGKALVSTAEAAHGIDAVPGRHLKVASDASEFADAVIGLLDDESVAADLGRAARKQVESAYSWDSRLGVLANLLAR